MQLPALCCGTSLLLLVLPWAGAQPASGEHGAELRSLQALLEALGQLWEEEGEPGLEDKPVAGAEDGGSEWELPGAKPGVPEPGVPVAQGQSQWRSLLSSYRRRHFSSCFGTRMERIGAQTGLGCNEYKARGCRVRARGFGSGGGRSSPRKAERTGLKASERLPQQLSALLS